MVASAEVSSAVPGIVGLSEALHQGMPHGT